MSYDTAMDFLDAQDGGELEPNATCHDCGSPYSRAEDDSGVWCDACSDRRDAHTSQLELRMTQERLALLGRLPTVAAMAKARAGKPIPKKAVRRREVA